MNIKVGQPVYVKSIGNAARHKKGEALISEAVVETVGRKWFTLEKYWGERFSLENGYNDGKGYSCNFIVYESRQQILDEQEVVDKCREISKGFEYGHNMQKLSLEDIRVIHKILFKE